MIHRLEFLINIFVHMWKYNSLKIDKISENRTWNLQQWENEQQQQQ